MNITQLKKRFNKFEKEAYSETGEDILFGYLHHDNEKGYYVLGYDKQDRSYICPIFLSNLLDNSIFDNIINFWERADESIECAIAQLGEHETEKLKRLEKQQARIQKLIKEI